MPPRVRRLRPIAPAMVAALALVLLGALAPAAAADDTSVAGAVFGPWEGVGYPPPARATVTVHAAGNESTVVATTATSASGAYRIEGLAPGDYKLHLAGDPSSHQPQWYGGSTFATALVITITPGTHLTFYDAHLLDATTPVAGTAHRPWLGAYRPWLGAGRPPLAGATVRVHAAGNGSTVVATVTTSGAGSYLFEGLAPGDYKLHVTSDASLHQPRWYGGSTFATAALVTITPRTHITFYDAYLAAATTSTARTVHGPDGEGPADVSIEAPSGEIWARSRAL